VELRPAVEADAPLIRRWLEADHVRAFWGEPETNARLLAPPAPGEWRAIILAEARAVGLVIWRHPTRQELDQAGLTEIPATAIDLDIMLGEDQARGRGLGAAAIALVAERALADPAVPLVIAAVMAGNQASLRAFAKAGFQPEREFDEPPGGRHVLMARWRRTPDQAP